MKWLVVLLSLAVSGTSSVSAQDPTQPPPVLRELELKGATVFSREDILWLLKIREGAPLPKSAAEIAESVKDAYERDGYSEAKVTAAFEAGRLSLTVDEGRIDEIEILGVTGASAERLRRRLGIEPGDIYNERIVGRAGGRLTTEARGAFVIGRPGRDQPGRREGESGPDEIVLERRGARNVLVVPLRARTVRAGAGLGSGREELFSPVDGLAPAFWVSTTIFDHAQFNHTDINAYVSYKFGRDRPSFSLGAERPLFGGPKLFLGGEVHDVTATDDRWRLTSVEQTIVSAGFKNTFRDYYRRQGVQVFTVLHAGSNDELTAMARWDHHEPLLNSTTFSLFRDDATYRPNAPVRDQHVNALVLGYTFDTRRLTGAGEPGTYERHLKDNLFGYGTRQRPGFRLEWTSEFAGRAMQGDANFDRHILNARGYVAITSRTLLSMRGLFGFSNGGLPIERRFAIGGIGSVHGYSFKEAAGTGLALLNAEYRVNLFGAGRNHDAAHVFAFYDAGRVAAGRPVFVPGFVFPTDSDPGWLRGVGAGIGAGGVRVEFGFRANDIPQSRQILVRWSPTF